MKTAWATLIKRSTADGLVSVEPHVPLGQRYRVVLASRAMADGFNIVKQIGWRREGIAVWDENAQDWRWMPTEILAIDTGGRTQGHVPACAEANSEGSPGVCICDQVPDA